jgi:hypothetical protein
LISKKDLTTKEKKSIRRLRHTVCLQTANGIITVTHEVDVRVRELGNEKVTAIVMENAPAVLSLGKLCEENGYDYIWRSGTKPYLQKGGLRVICQEINNVPLITPACERAGVDSEQGEKPEEETVTKAEKAVKPEETLSQENQNDSDIAEVPELVDSSSDPGGNTKPKKIKNEKKKERLNVSTLRSRPLHHTLPQRPEL